MPATRIRIARLAVLALWLLGVCVIGWGGRTPGFWQQYYQRDLSYPWLPVLVYCGIAAIETGVLYALLRPATYTRDWGRALAAFLVFFAWLDITLPPTDMPGYLYAHTDWLLIVCVALLGLFVISLAGAVIFRLKVRRT